MCEEMSTNTKVEVRRWVEKTLKQPVRRDVICSPFATQEVGMRPSPVAADGDVKISEQKKSEIKDSIFPTVCCTL